MCRHRFGVLNDMYLELQSEGYTEINISGVNGFQYINDDYHCMVCDDECTSSSCDGGPRILPWAQDLDGDGNDNGDVWDSWDISLRDLVFLDRDGNYITRLNLTGFNPDPTALGECTGNYDTIKELIISLY